MQDFGYWYRNSFKNIFKDEGFETTMGILEEIHIKNSEWQAIIHPCGKVTDKKYNKLDSKVLNGLSLKYKNIRESIKIAQYLEKELENENT